jgi:hypothetical protein
VVVSAESALPEVAGTAGTSVPGEDLAAGVRAVLARPEPAGQDGAGREPANLNALSRPSGNLQHHKRLPLARLKVWNRSSECNEKNEAT